MPRSKRAKVVHTSVTKKKGKELTLRLYANIQECIPKYPYIYVFRVDNMRNTYLKDVRARLSDSRLFFGKTKVMAVALGLTPESEPYPSSSRLSPHLHGDRGLIMSPSPPSEILPFFSSFRPADFARAGIAASRTFILPAGILHSRGGEIPIEEDVPLAHGLEPSLRRLGVPTRLVKGKVELDEDFVICRQGDVLGSGQTTLLKMFGVTMAEFSVAIVAWLERDSGKLEVMEAEEGRGQEMDLTTSAEDKEESVDLSS